jgi:hypothetical protein
MKAKAKQKIVQLAWTIASHSSMQCNARLKISKIFVFKMYGKQHFDSDFSKPL